MISRLAVGVERDTVNSCMRYEAFLDVHSSMTHMDRSL
jgi:hypothetical protein